MYHINKIKENLSQYFVALISSYQGYKVQLTNSNDDVGVDLTIKKIKKYENNGRVRYTESSEAIDVQLKATTKESVDFDNGLIKYDLEVKNYNDLIERKNEGLSLPLILILFILPNNDKSYWLTEDIERLIIKAKAYWYYPESNVHSNNKSTQRINIPLENHFSLDSLDKLFIKFHGR